MFQTSRLRLKIGCWYPKYKRADPCSSIYTVVDLLVLTIFDSTTLLYLKHMMVSVQVIRACKAHIKLALLVYFTDIYLLGDKFAIRTASVSERTIDIL